MIQTMATTGDFPLLLGGLPTLQAAEIALEEFWARYKAVFPQHGVFRKIQNSGGKVKTSQLLPILVHGDEGTTYKRGGMLVIQFSAVIGSGSNHSKAKPEWNTAANITKEGIPLNLVKTALQTRFLTFLCPRDWGGFCPNICVKIDVKLFFVRMLVILFLILFGLTFTHSSSIWGLPPPGILQRRRVSLQADHWTRGSWLEEIAGWRCYHPGSRENISGCLGE